MLRGLLIDIHKRCAVLQDMLSKEEPHPDVATYSVGTYRDLERLKREIKELIDDPALCAPELLANQFQEHKRWSEQLFLLESYAAPAVLKYGPEDQLATRLCRRMATQFRYPHNQPTVLTFSHNYYWTQPALDLIWVPTCETSSLLGLPDLAHELGHVLLFHNEARFLNKFFASLTAHYQAELDRVVRDQRPPELANAIRSLFIRWKDHWVKEFASDIIAAYLVGPAFGWQHLRLCTRMSLDLFESTDGVHPCDDARMSVINESLVSLGAKDAANKITAKWQEYVKLSGDQVPADFSLYYPASQLTVLVTSVLEACAALKLKSFSEPANPGQLDIGGVLNEAWTQFLADPASYPTWESATFGKLAATIS